MLLPGVTGLGVPVAVTAKSSCPAVATVTEAVDTLLPVFGSGVDAEIEAVLDKTVPDGAAAGTAMTIGKVAVPFSASEPMVQLIVPEVPAVGVLQDQPVGTDMETNVALTVAPALLAVGSVNTTADAVAGPLLMTTAVIVKFVPAVTVGADGVFVTPRSACVPVLTVLTAVAVLFARFGSLVPDVTLSTSVI
jgi:hypothetical protein